MSQPRKRRKLWVDWLIVIASPAGPGRLICAFTPAEFIHPFSTQMKSMATYANPLPTGLSLDELICARHYRAVEHWTHKPNTGNYYNHSLFDWAQMRRNADLMCTTLDVGWFVGVALLERTMLPAPEIAWSAIFARLLTDQNLESAKYVLRKVPLAVQTLNTQTMNNIGEYGDAELLKLVIESMREDIDTNLMNFGYILLGTQKIHEKIRQATMQIEVEKSYERMKLAINSPTVYQHSCMRFVDAVVAETHAT